MHQYEFDIQDPPFERGEDGAVLWISNVLLQASPRGFEPDEDIPARSRWSLRGL